MTEPLPHPVACHGSAQPQHLALCDGVTQHSRRISYGALARSCAALAAWAAGEGVAPGDRVGLFGPQTVDFVQVLYGLSWLGVVAVPLPTEGPQAGLAARLQRAGARSCMVLDEAVAQDWARASAFEGVRCLTPPTHALNPAGGPNTPSLPPAGPWRLDQPLLLLETSGTSGTPTQVELTVQQVLMQSLGSAARLGHRPDDVWLDVLPLHHIGGLMILMRALIFGASACVPGKFEAAHMAELLQKGSITLTSVVPTMLARMLPHLRRRACHPNVRAILLGGAPTPQALFDEATGLGIPVALTWGMTEAASGVCVRPPKTAAAARTGHKSHNAGPPLAFTQVTADADGVLHVTGPTVAGTLRTGDRGAIEPDGSVNVLGRCDRVIISGGENIAPEEVEAVLLSHADVLDAAVVGVPDAQWGERPVAHVVGRVAIPDRELVAFCRARLASFQIPMRFVWHAELPRNAMGKLQRAALVSGAAEDSR